MDIPEGHIICDCESYRYEDDQYHCTYCDNVGYLSVEDALEIFGEDYVFLNS